MNNLKIFLYILGGMMCIGSFSFSVYYAYMMVMETGEQSVQLMTEAETEYKYHVVLIPEELDNDYWRLVERGAKKAAEEKGVLIEYMGPKQANIDEHIKVLEMGAASKVDGILTQGLTEDKFTPLINKIVAKGIPVITVDTDASGSERSAYIGTDNYYSGFLAGKALIADTKGKANVAIITGSFGATHQQLRVQGFKDAIATEDGIKIIAIEESSITRIQAADKAYKIIKDHPEVNAFYGTSALDGIGIAKVVEQLERGAETYIIGFDVLPETLAYIEKGTIEATVVQEPYEMGYKGILMMVDLLDGKDITEINHTQTNVIHKEDIPLAPAERFEVYSK